MKLTNRTPAYITAAQICGIIALLWALMFLSSVSIGSWLYTHTPALRYVLQGIPFGAMKDFESLAQLGSYCLFVVLTRYLIVFSVGWPIFTWIIHAIQKGKET